MTASRPSRPDDVSWVSRRPITEGESLTRGRDVIGDQREGAGIRIPVLGLLVMLASAGVAFPSSRLDGAAQSMVFLLGPPKRIDGGQVERAFGSGFFIVRGGDLLLATAEHVARGLQAGALAVIRGPDGKALKLDLQKLAGLNLWGYHPTADLALVCLSRSEASLSGLQGRFLPVSVIRGEASAPARSITLTVLGFPLAFGVEGEFSPISRDTRPASAFLTTARADTKRPAVFFVTQDPSVGGFSGAPVFDTGLPYSTAEDAIRIDGRPMQIVGVAHGTASDNTGGKLGLITPGHLLLELLSQHQCVP